MRVAVVNMARVLDESAPGKQGAERLRAAWRERKAAFDKLAGEEKAALDKKAQAELDALRRSLAEEVLKKAQQELRALCKERQISLVYEQSNVLLVADPSVDLTGALLQRMAGQKTK